MAIRNEKAYEQEPNGRTPVVVSASRRTDIPSFYSDWFIQRLQEGFVIVTNPFNPSQRRRVSLSPDDVACIVFWTRNPKPILEKIEILKSFEIPFYFLITINSYGKILEPRAPSAEDLLPAFNTLARIIHPERIRWRYDPIILTDEIGREHHYRTFEKITAMLEGRTERCIISFFHGYAKSLRNLFPIIPPRTASREEKLEIASQLSNIARSKGIALQWCAPDDDLSEADFAENGILRAGCIDAALVEKLSARCGWKKDSGQRKSCLCAQSIDIGAYNTCAHGCRYCYATANHDAAHRFYRAFNQKNASLGLRDSSQFSSSPSSSKSKNLPM